MKASDLGRSDGWARYVRRSAWYSSSDRPSAGVPKSASFLLDVRAALGVAREKLGARRATTTSASVSASREKTAAVARGIEPCWESADYDDVRRLLLSVVIAGALGWLAAVAGEPRPAAGDTTAPTAVPGARAETVAPSR